MGKRPRIGNIEHRYKNYDYYTVIDIYRYYRAIKKSNKEKFLKKQMFLRIVNGYFRKLLQAMLAEGYVEKMGYGLGDLKLSFGVTGRHGAMVNWKDSGVVGREIHYNNMDELFRYYYIWWVRRKAFCERHYMMETTPTTKKKIFEAVTLGNIKLP